MSDKPEYIGVHFEEDHKMFGTWSGPAKGDIYVNILRHQKVIERAETAEAKLEKAKEALEFYAEWENWISLQPHEDSPIDNDEGDKARATLKELEGKIDE